MGKHSIVNEISVSYTIHLFSSSTVSFGLLFARVWQFLTGSIFFELEGALEVDPTTTKQYEVIGTFSECRGIIGKRWRGSMNTTYLRQGEVCSKYRDLNH